MISTSSMIIFILFVFFIFKFLKSFCKFIKYLIIDKYGNNLFAQIFILTILIGLILVSTFFIYLNYALVKHPFL